MRIQQRYAPHIEPAADEEDDEDAGEEWKRGAP
jgi:hypothetical protein